MGNVQLLGGYCLTQLKFSLLRSFPRFGDLLPCSMFSIRIEADFAAFSFQETRKLKCTATLELTTISTVICIRCCQSVLFLIIISLI
jgi:hypothetical protein